MAKAYVICPILGDGSSENPFRSAVDEIQNTNATSVIKTDSQGVPVFNFAFSRVGTQTLNNVLLISNSYVFPDYPLDGELSGMEATTRNAMKQSAEAYNLDGQGFHLSIDLSDLSKSYRQLLISVYQQFDPLLSAANFNNFDVTEPQ